MPSSPENQKKIGCQTGHPLEENVFISVDSMNKRATHAWYKIQRCVSWCWPNPEYHKSHAPFLVPHQGSKKIMTAVLSAPYVADLGTSMAKRRMENSTGKDMLLLKHQLCLLFPV